MENQVLVKDTMPVTLSIVHEFGAEKIAHSIPQYLIPNNKIQDISFSSTSPGILYVLVENEIFSLRDSTLALTKMVISGLSHGVSILNLLCHDEFIYITCQLNVQDHRCTVYKCIIEDERTLKPIGSYNDHTYSQAMCTCVSKTGILYCCGVHVSSRILALNTDVMKLRSSHYLLHWQNDIAVIEGELHVATRIGIHIYTANGVDTCRSYLDGEVCTSITHTSSGSIIVGMVDKMAVVSSDLRSINYLFISLPSTGYFRVRYNTVDGSLAVLAMEDGHYWDESYYKLLLLPPRVYQQPFSLISLCMSTIAQHADVLPIHLLPARLRNLVQ